MTNSLRAKPSKGVSVHHKYGLYRRPVSIAQSLLYDVVRRELLITFSISRTSIPT